MRPREILVIVALAALVSPAPATTHYVDVGGSGDFEDIWSAVDAAAATGDTILVAPGTYLGAQNRNINPGGKNIVFLAEGGARVPVTIDCGSEARAFRFDTGENDSTLVSGFTIINGSEPSSGGAIVASGADIRIENCTFTGNWASINGGALYFFNSYSSVDNCVFRGNSVGLRGGAVYSYGTGNTFTNCMFDENMIDSDDPPDQSGGAFYINSSSDQIEYCTLAENDVDQVLISGSESSVLIIHSLITGGPSGKSVAVASGGVGTVTQSACFGNVGGDAPECFYVDVIFSDPLYCDDTQDDYSLCDDSYAVDYNNIWHEQLGAYGSGCEPCGTPVEDATWGAVKALFRIEPGST